MSPRLSGIVSPNLTPFNADLSPAGDLYVSHAKWLINNGCSTIAPFGTTGEALSLSKRERMDLLDLLLEEGVPADRMMVGTGLNNLDDTADLSRHAAERGVAGVLALPPFYFKDVSDDGLHAYFKALIARLPPIRIYLYHIPPVAAVGFSLDLIKRLRADFPERIVGLKDSSGEWRNTESILREVPGLETFPGNELRLLDALRIGASGCITATANINAPEICGLFENRAALDAERRQERVRAFRAAVQGYAPIPAMKWLLANATGDARWKILRPPLQAISDARGEELKARLAEAFEFDLAASLN